MKKIIVLVDFSEHSIFALKSAAKLAKKNNAEILALHMLEDYDSNVNESQSYQQEKTFFLLKLAEKRFEELLESDYLLGIKTTPIVKRYKSFSEVNEVVQEENADLILMGSHGASGLKEFFVGSNTEKVIRYANVPVLVIKHELDNVNFETIVFPTDFSKDAIPAYNEVVNFARNLKAKLQILYVNTPYKNFKTSVDMEALAASFLQEAEGDLTKLNTVNFVADHTIEKGILNFANVAGADLVAMRTHGRKGLSHIFNGSISEDIANHSQLPILTLKY